MDPSWQLSQEPGGPFRSVYGLRKPLVRVTLWLNWIHYDPLDPLPRTVGEESLRGGGRSFVWRGRGNLRTGLPGERSRRVSVLDWVWWSPCGQYQIRCQRGDGGFVYLALFHLQHSDH